MKPAILTTLCLLAATPRCATPKIHFWPADPLVKVFEDTEPPAQSPESIAITACQNEWQCAQLAVRAEEPVAGVGLVVERGLGPTSSRAVPQVRCAFVGFVDTEEGRWPDPLLDQQTIDLKPNVTQPIWISVYVPPDMPPGTYAGAVRLSLGQAALARADLKIRVLPLRLPDPQDFRFLLGIWQAPTRISRHYKLDHWSDQHWKLLDAYTADLAQHGQDYVTVGRGLIEWRRKADGSFAFDYSLLDRYVEHCAAHGIDRGIEYLQMFNGRRETEVSYFDEAQNKTVRWKGFLPDEHYDVPWLAFLRDFARHLRDKGWMEKTWICPTDEPRDSYYGHTLADFRHCVELLKAADPDYKVTVALDSLDSARKLAPVIDRFVFKLRDDVYDRTFAQQLLAQGKRVEWYICCHPDRPNTFITSDLIDARVIGWQTFQQNLGGLLRWSYTAWPEDPWANPRGDGRYRSGDLFIVYPGQAGPVNTLRWEVLRQGIQDYELLRMLREAIERAEQDGKDVSRQRRTLDNTVRAVAGDPEGLTTFTTDPDKLRRARRALLDALLSL